MLVVGAAMMKPTCMAMAYSGEKGEWEEYTQENTQENTQETYSDLEDETVFAQLDNILQSKTNVRFSDIYMQIKSGDVDGACRLAGTAFTESLIYELRTSRLLAIQIIAVIVLGSIFVQVSGDMGEYVMESGFMVTYMVLISLLLGDFFVVQEIVRDTLQEVTEFIKIFYPMYATSILYVQGSESAKYSQSIILLVIYICQNGVIKFVLPLIKCSGLIALINNINREDYFSRLSGLMRSVSKWCMGGMFAVVTGINVVKSMIAPSIDRVSRNGVLKTLGKMTGMSSVSAVISVIISTGEFIRNCMGVTCTIVVIIIVAVPMIKIIVIIFTLRCIAALVQPACDKRFSDGISIMAGTVELMLGACGVSVMMFIISIALMAMSLS